MTIIKRDSAPMGHFHVCDDSAAPCDDPEDQMVVAIVQSVRDAAEGRCTNFIVSPEILRYSRQVLENEAQEEEPNECIRTLRELVSQWSQEEDTMDPTSPEEDIGRGDKSLATQMGGVRCRMHGWRVGRDPWTMRDTGGTEVGNQHRSRSNGQIRYPSQQSREPPRWVKTTC
jgi:hypothetical protein